jgi:RNA polymerase sigma factor (sigma-70 family)
MTGTPEEAAATSAPDPFSASRLHPEAARARTEELFRRHGRLVVGLCRGLLRNSHEAEDAAQQAFLSAHGAFLRGADPDDPARWLTAIARNECLTRIREGMRRPLPVANADSTASSADPVAEAARRADIGALWRAVGELAPQQREALLLREFGGLSYDELAVALGVSVPAVESLLFRARTRLRMGLRAATAALGGLLPRLLAGGGAAKVAGVTVAASLLTCGVVAGERQLMHHPAPPVRVESHPSSASILSDVPRTAAPIALPSARPARPRVPRRRPRAQSVRVVFTPPVHAPVPAKAPPPAAAPTASDGGDTRTPVVVTEDPSDDTVSPDSSQQTTTDSSSGGDDSSGDTSSTTTTTEPSSGSGTDGGSDSTTTTTTSDGGADSHP